MIIRRANGGETTGGGGPQAHAMHFHSHLLLVLALVCPPITCFQPHLRRPLSFSNGGAPRRSAGRRAPAAPGPGAPAPVVEAAPLTSRRSAAAAPPSASMSSNVEELESLKGEGDKGRSPEDRRARDSTFRQQKATNNGPRHGDDKSDKHIRQQKATNSGPRRPIGAIAKTKIGKLSPSELKSLLTSIRHVRNNESLKALRILERILLELEYKQSNHKIKGDVEQSPVLRPVQIFGFLSTFSLDVKAWKAKQIRNKKKSNYIQPKYQKVRKGQINSLVRVVNLLRKLKGSNFVDPRCYTPDVPSFAAMIASDASCWERSACDAALRFLELVDLDEASDEADPRLVGAVLNSFALWGRAEDAQDLLAKVVGMNIESDMPPSTRRENKTPLEVSKRLPMESAGPCYDAVLRAWSQRALHSVARAGKWKTASLCMEQGRNILLNQMSKYQDLTITNQTVSALLNGYSALGLGQKAETLMMEVESLQATDHSAGSLSASSLDVGNYNSVLHACSLSHSVDDVVIAERIFASTRDQTPLAVSTGSSDTMFIFHIIPPKADLISYSTMINCYCNHGKLEQAEDLLSEMHGSQIKPTVACYLPVLRELGRKEESDVACERTLLWLETIENEAEERKMKSSRLAYISALRAARNHGRPDVAMKVLDMFHKAVRGGGAPDLRTYLLVLRSFENSHDRTASVEGAERLFRSIVDKVEEGKLSGNVDAYKIILSCYARAGEGGKAEGLLKELESKAESDALYKPDSRIYSLVIKALALSGDKDAVTRAWRVMSKAGYPYEQEITRLPGTRSPDLTVDVCNSMLKLLGSSKYSLASDAEAVFETMDELRILPNLKSYEAILTALARSDDPGTPERAEALVTRLEVSSEMGYADVQPSLLLYNTLLNVSVLDYACLSCTCSNSSSALTRIETIQILANFGRTYKAERLLERLDSPDRYSFGTAIKAIANRGKSAQQSIIKADLLEKRLQEETPDGRSNEIVLTHRLKLLAKFGMGKEAEDLLRRQERDGLVPVGVVHYTAAINAHAKSMAKDAVKKAEALFRVMDEKFDLDLAAYHGLLLVYSNRGNVRMTRELFNAILSHPDIRPNRITFTIVMEAYVRRKNKHAGERAEGLLNQVGGGCGVRPAKQFTNFRMPKPANSR